MRLKRHNLSTIQPLCDQEMAPKQHIWHNGGCGYISEIASSPKEANEISEKTMVLSILSILANKMTTTLCFRAHESHVVVDLTPVCTLVLHAFLQRKLLVVSSKFWAAALVALCC